VARLVGVKNMKMRIQAEGSFEIPARASIRTSGVRDHPGMKE